MTPLLDPVIIRPSRLEFVCKSLPHMLIIGERFPLIVRYGSKLTTPSTSFSEQNLLTSHTLRVQSSEALTKAFI
jgi:hypothetical protein